jgi:hypothetical protein
MFGDAEVSEFDFRDPSPVSAADANEELTAKSNAAVLLVDAGWDPDDVLELVGLPKMKFLGPIVPQGMTGPPPAPRPTLQSVPAGRLSLPSPPNMRQDPPEELASDDNTFPFSLDLGKELRDAFDRARMNGHDHKEEVDA